MSGAKKGLYTCWTIGMRCGKSNKQMLAKNVNRETESQTSDTDNKLPTKFDLSIWSDNSDTANTHSITNSNLKKTFFSHVQHLIWLNIQCLLKEKTTWMNSIEFMRFWSLQSAFRTFNYFVLKYCNFKTSNEWRNMGIFKAPFNWKISAKFNSIQLLQAANMHCHSSFEFGKPCKSFHLMHRFYEKHAMCFDILHILHIWKSIMFDSNEIHFLIVFYAKLCYFGSHEIMDCWQPISTWILHAIRC